MRSGVVAAGVLMMIIGAGLIFFLPAIMEKIGGERLAGIPIAHMGPIIGGLGFLVFIAGLAASPPQKPQPVIVQQTVPPTAVRESLVICPECDAHVSAKSKFCPECGMDLRLKLEVEAHETEGEPDTKTGQG